MRYMYVHVFIIITCFYSCENKYDEVHSLENVPTNEELLPNDITSLIDKCIKCGCHWRFDEHIGKRKLIRYSKSYFSPDSSKAFIIVVHQINDVENRANPNVDFEIRGDAFIGYKKGEEWMLYIYGAMMPVGYYSYKEVEEMIAFFEGDNYRKKIYTNYYENNEKSRRPVGVSPNNPEFWESQLWQQKLEIEGLYPFEIYRSNIRSVKEFSINELLKLVDSCK